MYKPLLRPIWTYDFLLCMENSQNIHTAFYLKTVQKEATHYYTSLTIVLEPIFPLTLNPLIIDLSINLVILSK